ncbi:Os03g0267450 [Oryza sativa Japonica Group]|uniref:Os03g0267450 protein n=1 Tax=Oryza sativa subsp. japonica TaxID=39947 RepID=A0A0P0VVX3_ORYSJ|nr:Os03g0267450 [Oryza sativa Japonica Group]
MDTTYHSVRSGLIIVIARLPLDMGDPRINQARVTHHLQRLIAAGRPLSRLVSLGLLVEAVATETGILLFARRGIPNNLTLRSKSGPTPLDLSDADARTVFTYGRQTPHVLANLITAWLAVPTDDGGSGGHICMENGPPLYVTDNSSLRSKMLLSMTTITEKNCGDALLFSS